MYPQSSLAVPRFQVFKSELSSGMFRARFAFGSFGMLSVCVPLAVRLRDARANGLERGDRVRH